MTKKLDPAEKKRRAEERRKARREVAELLHVSCSTYPFCGSQPWGCDVRYGRPVDPNPAGFRE